MKVCPQCDHINAADLQICESCGADLDEMVQDEAELVAGTMVAGKYEICELIGQGAMGRVYKAIQKPIHREVAIKVLHGHLLEDRRVARRFQREAEAASRFNHPNSIGIFDFGHAENESLYIAMEYITGRDLAAVIASHAPMERERVVRVSTQVLNALHMAHASSIIHRDLKPENIMLSDLPGQKDFVKVCDFGIAKIQQPSNNMESALTMMGMICGTPYYMSPEQARGEELDGRSDLYSMGVILYEMLTGEVPFRGSTPVEVIARHLTDQPLPPSKLRPNANIPRSLEAVVMKALSKKREDRFLHAQEMSEALEGTLNDEAELKADLESLLYEVSDANVKELSRPDTADSIVHAQIPRTPALVGAPVETNRVTPAPASILPQITGQASSGAILPRESKDAHSALPTPPLVTEPKRSPVARSLAEDISSILPAIVPQSEDTSQSKIEPEYTVGRLSIGANARPSGYDSSAPRRGRVRSFLREDHVPEPIADSKRHVILLGILILVMAAAALWFFVLGPGAGDNADTARPPQRVMRAVSPSLRRQQALKKRKRLMPVRRRTRMNLALLRARRMRYQKVHRDFLRWQKKYQIKLSDMGSASHKLYRRALSDARRKRYTAATKHLKRLSTRVGQYKRLTRSITRRKFERLRRSYKSATRRRRAKVDALMPKLFELFSQRRYRAMNRYMNRAFRSLGS